MLKDIAKQWPQGFKSATKVMTKRTCETKMEVVATRDDDTRIVATKHAIKKIRPGWLLLAASLVVASSSQLFIMHEYLEIRGFEGMSARGTEMVVQQSQARTRLFDKNDFFRMGNNNNDTTTKEKFHEFPKWIAEYFTWHTEMRTKFPGTTLFTDPQAPNLLVRICIGTCGGLNDRLGQLPWDLYLANQTKRILLITWLHPAPLEEFLVPNVIDWSIPSEVKGFDIDDYDDMWYNGTWLFRGRSQTHPTKEFMGRFMDFALTRAIRGKYSDRKVILHRLLGHIHERSLEKRLQALGETDMIHHTPTFGRIFRALFKPSDGLQAALDESYSKLGVVPGNYTAVHLRVRHPKAEGSVTGSDANGLLFLGEGKRASVEMAIHAISCAQTLSIDETEQMYFFSDSNDLVQYMVHDIKSTNKVTNSQGIESKLATAAAKAVSSTRLVARDVSETTLHIDKQKADNVSAYYATFVDLFVAVNSRCITFGVGYFSVFASKLSGTRCKLLYQQEAWGAFENKTDHAPMCMPEMYNNSII